LSSLCSACMPVLKAARGLAFRTSSIEATPCVGDVAASFLDQVDRQGIDHAAHRLVDQAASADLRKGAAHLGDMPHPDAYFIELVQRDQSGAQAVVYVMVVVADLVGQVAQLRFERGLRTLDEAPAKLAQLVRLFRRAMLENAFARLVGQVEAVEGAIALLQQIDGAQALQVVLEAAMLPHASIQRILPGVAEWRMAQVVGQRDGFGQILVQLHRTRQRAGDLRDLYAVRQARAKQVAFMIDEDLGLVFETAERRRMHDAIAVALEFAARGRRRFRMSAPLRECASETA
jgi:hypothetical protein